MAEVRGYKVFNPDWTCRDKQYTCPGVFEESGALSICGHGMHFCKRLIDCFVYYDFNPKNKVAEVVAFGDIRDNGEKCCTDKLKIEKELTWGEVLEIVNSGIGNSGKRNSGNRNSGDWNSGNWNSGNCNSGDRNSGDWNSGNWNSGDWNSGNWNSGCFNTKESKINLFNKPSDWTYQDWLNSAARDLLNEIPKDVVEWIYESAMTDEEKAKNPSYKTTGGYLKVLDESECAQLWWDGLNREDKDVIKALPNFDADIFEECTGIKINESKTD